MRILIKLFGNYQDYLPEEANGNSFSLEFSGNICVKDVLTNLKIPVNEHFVILINGIGVSTNRDLKDRDTIAIFEAIAGG